MRNMRRTRRPPTLRQQRILALLARGYAAKQIAAMLGISVSGAKKHLESLRRRYGVANSIALLIAALEAGDVRLGTSRDSEMTEHPSSR